MRWACALLVLLAGCASDPAREVTGFSQTVAMTATAEFVDRDCFHEMAAGRCQWVDVAIDNTANDQDLDVGPLHWEAVGNDGGVYRLDSREGPDKIAAGAEGSMRLGFDVEGSLRMERLRYGAFGDVLLTVPIE